MGEFDKIRKNGRLLFEYIRGSHLYNLNTKDSDLDTGGVFICDLKDRLGFLGYTPQVSDSRHDNTWYELGNFIYLLTKSNPTVLEGLFAPDDKVIFMHPCLTPLVEYRDHLLTKDIYWPFYGYAKSQIEKARGLNKKIVNPVDRRKTPLEFTYTFYRQGSQLIEVWLNERGLKKEYCGLNKIPHMNDMYGLFYDWGAHVQHSADINKEEIFLHTMYFYFLQYPLYQNELTSYSPISEEFLQFIDTFIPIGYRGLVCEDANNTTQLRLSSIENADDIPLCWVSYNADGFKDHCRRYKEYQTWVKERNPVRYESNLDKTYDSKNLMHCFRLMHMCQEILQGQGFNLVRTDDKEFLFKIRNHEFEYDELIARLEEEKAKMELLYATTKLPDHVNSQELNDILIKIRKEFTK